MSNMPLPVFLSLQRDHSEGKGSHGNLRSRQQQQQLLHRQLQVQVCEIHSLQRRFERMSRQVTLLHSRCRDIEARMQMMMATSYNGILICKIPNIARRKREAAEGRTVCLESHPFYTSRCVCMCDYQYNY